MRTPAFVDRRHAGRELASALGRVLRPDPVVLALPRGGVPVGHEVARALGAPLDVVVVRKLGVPGREELAMGALASGGVRFLNDSIVRDLGIEPEEVEAATARARAELDARETLFRGGRAAMPVRGRDVILVDDGLATGASMRAAIAAVRAREPRTVEVAVPVAPRETLEELAPLVDAIHCLATPEPFYAVAAWYEDFEQTTDEEVRQLVSGAPRAVIVHVPIGHVTLEGTLTRPPEARGLVVFAHGSGSSRFSPRNRHVARVLNDAGLATLLLDLLTPGEEAVDEVTREHRFDLGLLANRLAGTIDWLGARGDGLAIGLFGSSTGGGAALVAAAQRPEEVAAVVSRGGRPDLAGPALVRVEAPTLLIVGGKDPQVLDLNRSALEALRCPKWLEVVPGATHLFEEPGALDRVAASAAGWFGHYLGGVAREAA